jgi:hypothetical protein
VLGFGECVVVRSIGHDGVCEGYAVASKEAGVFPIDCIVLLQ